MSGFPLQPAGPRGQSGGACTPRAKIAALASGELVTCWKNRSSQLLSRPISFVPTQPFASSAARIRRMYALLGSACSFQNPRNSIAVMFQAARAPWSQLRVYLGS